MPAGQLITILLAEDDADDRFLIQTAFMESRIQGQLRFVNDGNQLMDYLLQRGDYADESGFPRPHVVILDLNMPRKDGREALLKIKQDPALRNLPLVVLTTSSLKQDKDYCSELEVSDYIVKPNSYTGLLGVMNRVMRVYQNSLSIQSKIDHVRPVEDEGSTIPA
jgi:CheY-like chemotaxis protein